MTIKEIHEMLVKGEISATDLLARVRSKVDERNEELNAYLELFDDVDTEQEDHDYDALRYRATKVIKKPLSRGMKFT